MLPYVCGAAEWSHRGGGGRKNRRGVVPCGCRAQQSCNSLRYIFFFCGTVPRVSRARAPTPSRVESSPVVDADVQRTKDSRMHEWGAAGPVFSLLRCVRVWYNVQSE